MNFISIDISLQNDNKTKLGGKLITIRKSISIHIHSLFI